MMMNCGCLRLWIIVLSLTIAGPALSATPSAAVSTAAVQNRNLTRTVEAYGRVEAAPDAVNVLSLPRASIITRLAVRKGQQVAKGQLLYRVKTAPSARQTYLEAQAALQAAQANLKRVANLHSEQLATNADLAAAQQAASDAKTRLESLKALGADKRTEDVLSPVAGIVTDIGVATGQRVPADSMAVTLTNPEGLQIVLGVEPEIADRIQSGAKVAARQVFGTAAPRHGRVSQIGGTLDPATRQIDVVVAMDSGTHLQVGQRFVGTITIATAQGPAVPRSAVLRDKQGTYLFVVKAGKAHRINIHPGIEAGGYIAVPDGVRPGDRVVIQGNYELSDGMAVREEGA